MMLDNANMWKYTERMKRSMMDKISYNQEIEVNAHFDYGCADGTTIEFIARTFPDHFFFGFDINPEMVQLAKSKNIHNATFSTNFDELTTKMNQLKCKRTVLILNSIIHEVYSYLDKEGIDEFWDRVFNNGFDYITIRDMSIDSALNDGIDRINAKKIRDKVKPHLIESFEKKYGSIDNMVNQTHFLLKYHYENNWKNELKENYLICTHDEYKKIFLKYASEYKIIMNDYFKIRFLSEMVNKDFGVDFPGYTHVKFILEKRNGK